MDARDPAATFPPIEPLRPPEGAPNVLVILIDDAGFGSSSAFGGPCETPNFERLANNGLRYAKDGKPAYCYNLFRLQLFKIAGEEAIRNGTHQVRMESPTTAVVSAKAGM